MRRVVGLIFALIWLSSAVAQTPGSGANQTLLTLKLGGLPAPVTVKINGGKIGDYLGDLKLDVSNHVRPGENTLQVSTTLGSGSGTVQVSHAVEPSKFRTVVMLELPFTTTSKRFDQTLSFTLPSGAGRKNTAAPPSAPSTPSTGSSTHQTVLRCKITASGAKLPIGINGVSIGDFTDDVTLDVSRFVRPGENTLSIPSQKLDGIATLEIAHALEPSKFRTIGKLEVGFNTSGDGKVRTLKFNLPSGAGRPGYKPVIGNKANALLFLEVDVVKRAPVTVLINGQTLGPFTTEVKRLDVTRLLKPDQNQLELRFTKPLPSIFISARIAYTPDVTTSIHADVVKHKVDRFDNPNLARVNFRLP